MSRTKPIPKTNQILQALFESQREEWLEALADTEFEKLQSDFVFHMTDWKDDLQRLADWYRDPKSLNDNAAATMLLGFLYHVTPYLNAAAKLLLDDIGAPFAAADYPLNAKSSAD